MCDYLERMKKTNVPTKEIRLWSGFAHRVVEYTGPFPTPADRAIMLWLHEESATMLLDMCDDVDEKFSELEAENAKLRELLSMYVRFAQTVLRGVTVKNSYPKGPGKTLNETEMRERALELGVKGCK